VEVKAVVRVHLVVLLCLAHAASLSPQGCAAHDSDEVPWEEVSVGAGKIAVPKGWRSFTRLGPNTVLYRQGAGIGVPALDETKSPLQIGLTVEKFPGSKDPVDEVMGGLVEAAKKAPRLTLLGKEHVQAIKLSDGTEAMLLKAEFIKEESRHSLQLKLVAKDAESNAWIVSGYVVGGNESKWPTPDTSLAKWLEAHITSFCLDGTKFDAENVEAAYKNRNKK
jgi:hypothetical protein